MGGKRGAVKGETGGINERREDNQCACGEKEGQNRISSAAIRTGRDKIQGVGVGVGVGDLECTLRISLVAQASAVGLAVVSHSRGKHVSSMENVVPGRRKYRRMSRDHRRILTFGAVFLSIGRKEEE
jgi:hypothetical protein